MDELKYKVSNKGAKPQALGLFNDLKKHLPIERAKMILKVTIEEGQAQNELMEHLNQEKFKDQFSLEKTVLNCMFMTVDPSMFREISEKFKSDKSLFAQASVEIVDK